MPAKIRVLWLEEPISAALGLALEEALVRRIDEGSSGPVALVWRARPAVVIGVNPKTLEEVDLKTVKMLQIPLLRRESGGGAVYLDPGCLVYSVLTQRGSLPDTAEERYGLLSSGLINLLADLGLTPEFRDLGVWVSGRKVSGTAERVLRTGILHHGTLLVSSDLKTLEAVLTRPKAPVANLNDLLGGIIRLRELAPRLAESVALALGQPVWSSLTTEELKAAEALLPKYLKGVELPYSAPR